MEAVEFVVVALWWAIPVLVIVYVLRAIGTLIDGVRSVNAGVKRIAEGVEELVEAERRRSG